MMQRSINSIISHLLLMSIIFCQTIYAHSKCPGRDAFISNTKRCFIYMGMVAAGYVLYTKSAAMYAKLHRLHSSTSPYIPAAEKLKQAGPICGALGVLGLAYGSDNPLSAFPFLIKVPASIALWWYLFSNHLSAPQG